MPMSIFERDTETPNAVGGMKNCYFGSLFYVGKKLCCSSSSSRAQSFIIVNKRVSVVILSSYASGNRYLGDGDTDRREILHDGACRSRTDFLSFEGTPKGPQIKILTANISKTVSRSVTWCVTLARRKFSKYV